MDTQLTNSNSATYEVVNGVTYFKLISNIEGDYTKNCGLLGEEIDKNFFFLRGYDIKSIEVDENRNLIIERVDSNYTPITIPLDANLEKTTFAFDKESGTITITYPDNTTATMEGFLVEGENIRIASDSTLRGNGTMYNPLGIADIETTGTYSPADKYFDITATGMMPSGNGKGYRVVTKEKVDYFGELYPFSAVEKIQDKLTETNSQWRVPTKEDWDNLLNAMEYSESARNHTSIATGYFGEIAGQALKSADSLWRDANLESWETPVYGQDSVGFKALPLGRCATRNEMMGDTDNDAEGFKSFASFWCNTKNANGNAYSKSLVYNRRDVKQETLGNDTKMSIRLVKDYNLNNFNKTETIMGLSYETELIYGCDSYVGIWTTQNFYDSDSALEGIKSIQWSAATDSDKGVKVVYFINEWNGTEWNKKPMNEGDSVVIKDYLDTPYHEWRIISGTLVDTLEEVMEEVNEVLDEANEKISEISASTLAAAQKIEALENRQNVDEQRLDAVEPRVDAVEGRLDAVEPRVDNLENRQNVDEQRLNAIEPRVDSLENRQNVDEQRLDALEPRMNAVEGRLDSLEPRMNTAEGRLNAVETRVDAVENRTDSLEQRQNLDENRLNSLENRENVDEQRLDNLENRQNVDEQRLDAVEPRVDALENRMLQAETNINNEIADRIANDITTGEYTLSPNSTMVLPTNGESVEDINVKISDDFFNFGTF